CYAAGKEVVMIQIELHPEVEAQLAAEARARGLALERYIAEKLSEPRSKEGTGQTSVAEAISRIRQLRQGNRLDGMTSVELIGHVL
ncbi:MAG: hypothetical protein WBD46_14015, partial [Acidobacteriaceae bacterium]